MFAAAASFPSASFISFFLTYLIYSFPGSPCPQQQQNSSCSPPTNTDVLARPESNKSFRFFHLLLLLEQHLVKFGSDFHSAGSLSCVKVGNLLLLATGHHVYPPVSKTLHFKKNLIIIRGFHLDYFTRLVRKLFPDMMQMFAQVSSAPFSTCRCPPL